MLETKILDGAIQKKNIEIDRITNQLKESKMSFYFSQRQRKDGEDAE